MTKAPPAVLEQRRRTLGLDQPWHVLCWRYARRTVTSAASGELDLGQSTYYQGRPVAEILGLTAATWSRGAVRTTMTLGLLALALAVLVGANAGAWAAVRAANPTGAGRGGRLRGALADHLTLAVSVVGISLPTFVTGSMLILLLAVLLPAFPVGGWGTLRQAVLPTITLSLPFMAYIARLMRAGMLDVLHADYIRTARAKGLAGRQVVFKHAFKLAFLPVLSYLGPAAAAVLTGSFVVERLFAVPGMGEHFVTSVVNRDQPLIIATVVLYAVLLVSFNFLVDLAYVFVDPRISHKEAL
jgi:ABC-type dipeptide/oligopeptide/nickel transport system permease component